MGLLDRIRGAFPTRSAKGDTYRCTNCNGTFDEFDAECPNCGSQSVERHEIESQEHA